MSRVLVIDDNEGVIDALKLLLDLNGIDCAAATTAEMGADMVRRGGIDLVIQDMNFSADTTSGNEGRALFGILRDIDPDLPIILLTAWTHLEQAVELVKGGAADYLAKPWDDDKLLVTVRNLLALRRERNQNRARAAELTAAREAVAQKNDLCGFVYASSVAHEMIKLALKFARSDLPVLIQGPNGAGKQKIAEIIQANSAVADGPFVTLNAGALPSELVEAELFGAEAGAYTGATKARPGRFEAAHEGTLFLDEIGNLPMEGQAKLLRVLQSGEFERVGSASTRRVKVRVISATNADLESAVLGGRFREDLYYRLNVLSVDIPPLAKRRADILPLARHFLDEGHTLSPEAEARLTEYDWPGNVRELENRIQRACLLADGKKLTAADLDLSKPVEPEYSEADIRAALASADGVVARAARSLNLSRQSLYRRMEKLGIQH